MLEFYSRFTPNHDIAKHSGLSNRHDLPIITSFWMRRMADKTDTVLWDALTDRLAVFAPAALKALP